MTDELVTGTKQFVTTDPLDSVARAQDLFEKGPVTAVASFFALAFFVSLYLLLRAKDKHQSSQSELQADHAKEIARLTERHSEEMAALYVSERDRAVKHEVTMSNYLDMMEDVRFIAFEMRRVKMARDKRRRTTEEEVNAEGESDE